MKERLTIEIDEWLKHKVLIKAVYERKTIKQVVTLLLKEWVERREENDKQDKV